MERRFLAADSPASFEPGTGRTADAGSRGCADRGNCRLFDMVEPVDMLPFTSVQFFDVFVSYNNALWPLHIVAYALGLGAFTAAAQA